MHIHLHDLKGRELPENRDGWLLPALPAVWKQGKAKGRLCRGGIEVSIQWDMDKQEIHTTLVSRCAQKVTVKLPRPIRSIRCSRSESAVAESPLGSDYREIELPAGQLVSLSTVLCADSDHESPFFARNCGNT